jgi:carbamoyltransferase
MRILAVYYGHDANCTLLEDGEPVAVLEKERLTRTKHDQGQMDLEAILADYGWTPETIDIIVINPWVRPTLDGKWWQWELRGDTYRRYSDYMLDGWKGAPEGRHSQHKIRMFGRWYRAMPSITIWHTSPALCFHLRLKNRGY